MHRNDSAGSRGYDQQALTEAMAGKAPAAAARTARAYRPRRRLSMKPKAMVKRQIKPDNRRLAPGAGDEGATGRALKLT
jgi:hypothetical protein